MVTCSTLRPKVAHSGSRVEFRAVALCVIQLTAFHEHIGEGKLRMLIDEHPDEDFYVMNGNRVLIKREKFERYLDQATVV